jgi:hypothetical protein
MDVERPSSGPISNIYIPVRQALLQMLEIKGPLANIDIEWSFGFDIRIANPRLQVSECQIHSTRSESDFEKIGLGSDV